MFRDFIDDVDNYSAQPETFLDVPFVPTDENVLEAMLNLADVGPKDVLYDLGSGDGRILISAARDRNTRGIGIDIDPVRIADAMEEAGYAGVECLVDFIEEDIFDADFSEATVVTLYLLQSVNLQLRPQLLSQLRPGARIVSHAFNMGDWKADDWIKIGGINIYKWIVPAQVAGVREWQDRQGRSYRVELQQKFQDVTGSAWIDGVKASLESADLRGKHLELNIRDNSTNSVGNFKLTFENEKIRIVAGNE
ncbi:class I SAM-dependent methyltransferase [Paraburkholderia aspalathi]|nr:class I SAM-dependent methyltransferase [Paraburkholderia aspalathi]